MEAKARRQILTLLLTTTHYVGSLDMILIGWDNGGQVKTPVGWITTILNEYNSGNQEVAKDLADYLNNMGCTWRILNSNFTLFFILQTVSSF